MSREEFHSGRLRCEVDREEASDVTEPLLTVIDSPDRVHIGRSDDGALPHVFAEVACRERRPVRDELGRGPREDDASAVVTGTGTEIDEVVGMRHDRLMVLDDDDRASGVDESVEEAEQVLDVGQVQARRRFVEDDDRGGLGGFRRQVGGERGRRSPPESVVSGWPSLR